MKLLNPTQRVVFLRDEVNRKLIVLKPGEMTDVLPTQREVFSKYVQGFQLRWILEDEDLPITLRGTSEDRQGTLQYYKKHEQKDDTTFNAPQALAQSDAQEIADIWKDHDTVRYIPHVSTTKPITSGSEEDFLFLKEGSTTETQEQDKVIQEISPLTQQELHTLLTEAESEEGRGEDGDDTTSSSLFEDERRDIFRDTVFSHQSERDEDDELGEGGSVSDEETRLPDNAPVTLNQLNMSTKAQIWEMCDKLGLDASGTKKDLVKRITKYYQNVHYTTIHNANGGGTHKL